MEDPDEIPQSATQESADPAAERRLAAELAPAAVPGRGGGGGPWAAAAASACDERGATGHDECLGGARVRHHLRPRQPAAARARSAHAHKAVRLVTRRAHDDVLRVRVRREWVSEEDDAAQVLQHHLPDAVALVFLERIALLNHS